MKSDSIPVLLGAFSIGLITISCSTVANHEGREVYSPQRSINAVTLDLKTKGLGAVNNKPKTMIELIKNIKAALDSGLFRRHDFFNEDTLNIFFGAEQVVVRRNAENDRVTVFSRSFGEIARPVSVGGFVVPGISFRADIESNASKKIVSGGSFIIKSGPDFYEVQRIFDGLTEDRSIPLHGPSSPPTGSHGNERWFYVNDSALVRQKVNFEFDRAGTLSQIYFEEESK